MEHGQPLPLNLIEAKEEAAHACFRLIVTGFISLCFPSFSSGIGTSGRSSCTLGGVCYLQLDRDAEPLRLPIEGKASIDGECYSLAYSLPATGFSFEVEGRRGGSMLFEIDDAVLAQKLPSCARAGWTDLRVCSLPEKNLIAVAGHSGDGENGTIALRADRSSSPRW